MLWPPVGIFGSIIVGASYGFLAPIMATFDAVGEGKANNLIHCFLVKLIFSWLWISFIYTFYLNSIIILFQILFLPNISRMELGVLSKEVVQWLETWKIFACTPISRSWMIFVFMILQTESLMRSGKLCIHFYNSVLITQSLVSILSKTFSTLIFTIFVDMIYR